MKTVARHLKQLMALLPHKRLIYKTDTKIPKERFGSDYGGYELITAGLNADSVVYSFGVGEDASFDVALIERFGLVVHAFDPTPKSLKWVNDQGLSDHFVMHEYGIADFDGTASFNPPENPDHVSHTLLDRPATQNRAITVPVKRLCSIMKTLGHTRIDVLKLDVEGAEYAVIDDIQRSDVQPGQILVELHHRFPGVGIRKSTKAIATLQRMGYGVFSVSANNEEFCFVRRRG
jgi:FkbM family methyltransferase